MLNVASSGFELIKAETDLKTAKGLLARLELEIETLPSSQRRDFKQRLTEFTIEVYALEKRVSEKGDQFYLGQEPLDFSDEDENAALLAPETPGN